MRAAHHSRLHWGCFTLLTLLLMSLAQAQAAVWTATNGQSIEADLLGHGPEGVSVLTPGNRLFTFPLDMLVLEDRDRVVFKEYPQLPNASIERAVVTIEHKKGNGTGFIVQVGGKTYLYTNQHVILGAPRASIKAQNSRGELIRLGTLEICPDNDITRIRVPFDEGLFLAEGVSIGDQITAYGNSEGAGTLTANTGKVLGIGADEMEVDADIVPGNSGGPIVNDWGSVVGLATYIKRGDDEEEDKEAEGDGEKAQDNRDWVYKGTRYGLTRRFGLNLTVQREWTRVSWEQYVAQGQALMQKEQLLEDWIELFVNMFMDPGYMPDSASNHPHMVLNKIEFRQRSQAERYAEYMGDTVSPQRLYSLNKEIRDLYYEWVDESEDDLMHALSPNQRSATPITIDYLRQREQYVLDRAQAVAAFLKQHSRRLTPFRFRGD
jgi:V8-like Glu-specific endopeptidase